MGLVIALTVIIVSAVSYSLAVYLHLAVSFNATIEMNLYSGRQIAKELDPVFLTKLFKEGRKVYEGIPEEIRENRMSKEYLAYFDALQTPEYKSAKSSLPIWQNSKT